MIVFLLDQYLKLKSVIALSYIINPAIVLGFVGSNTVGIIVGVLAFAIVTYLVIKKTVHIYEAAVLIAALWSNLLDRMVYKGVVDYWNFFSFFKFNLADLLIVIVVIYLIIRLIREKVLERN